MLTDTHKSRTRFSQGLIDSTRRGHATSIMTAQSAKILIIATNECGRGQMEAIHSPVNATLVLVGGLGECF